MSWLRLTPLVLLAVLAGLLAYALLTRSSSNQTDQLIGEPVPAFALQAADGRPGFSPQSLEGGAYLLNVWGSWCPPCEAEHPFLMELRADGVPIYGLAWRDNSDSANAFLNRLGNPFAGVVLDPLGEAVISLGVTGAPETFVIDSQGIIRARWAGPLTRQIYDRELRPALEAG